MSDNEPDDPRDAEVVDPTDAPDLVKPSATGTVAAEGDEDQDDEALATGP